MRLIYILLLLIAVNSQYSKKECQDVLVYFNQGMKTNEILNMLSEDGVSLIDKIPQLLDNSFIQMGSSAGTLLYKKYLKNYVDECSLIYEKEQQSKADSKANWNIISWIAIFFGIWACLSCVCCFLMDEILKRDLMQRKQK